MAKITVREFELLVSILDKIANKTVGVDILKKEVITESVANTALETLVEVTNVLATVYDNGNNNEELSSPRDRRKSLEYSIKAQVAYRKKQISSTALTVKEISSSEDEAGKETNRSDDEAGASPEELAGTQMDETHSESDIKEISAEAETKTFIPLNVKPQEDGSDTEATSDDDVRSTNTDTEKKRKRFARLKAIRDSIIETIFWRDFSIREYFVEEAKFWRNFFKENMRTDNVYALLSWFTSFRLFVLRLNRLFKFHPITTTLLDLTKNVSKLLPLQLSSQLLKAAILASGPVVSTIFNAALKPFLKDTYKYLGLSYILEFIADLTVVFYSTFRAPVTDEDKSLPLSKLRWNRFKNVIFKDARGVRMTNAILWFGINITCIFITGGAAAWINVAGFALDVGVELYKLTEAYLFHRRLGNKVTRLIKAKEKLLDEMPASTEPAVKDAKDALKAEIETLKYTHEVIKHRGRIAWRSQIYPIVMTSLILIGMIMLAVFPPTTLIGFIGAGLAFAFGSMFFGLTRRLVNKAISIRTPEPQPPASLMKSSTDNHTHEPAPLLSHSISRSSKVQSRLLSKHKSADEYISFFNKAKETTPSSEVNSYNPPLKCGQS